ncbi:uroporphyrinogen-III C-methyltransferase [Leptospira langatensis]|uniref:uroporphyrinogen-III C-methyltransferase n=1 Tax=Leptospira langatensis TaxID=2484983 RepID=A0A5F1ZWV0_9LEPT|nr:uroporphyrinogen-III C-methyltransferase [Leptospira langatensis]TGK01505.1 uroporphyrinogen-III C-methyltransferase [Leptospira langatensis]TGL42045.1 uroporphyrinogen-III C-methyltransferase [Leptospira langatensis]
MKSSLGKVYLVGAGPGDPNLLTVRAVKLLRKADVILYDDLVSAEVLKYCRRSAILEYVGKRIGQHSCQQNEINRKLSEFAQEYSNIVRLKGGDPSIYGRAGEEIEHLASLGIECEMVAGVTTASGAASSLGIPLTHRDYAREILFLSGHKKTGKNPESFEDLHLEGKTALVYMGLNSLESIRENLLASGNSESTPIAFVENATTPKQRVVVATLGDCIAKAEDFDIKTPSLLILGEIVRFYIELEKIKEQGRNLILSDLKS